MLGAVPKIVEDTALTIPKDSQVWPRLRDASGMRDSPKSVCPSFEGAVQHSVSGSNALAKHFSYCITYSHIHDFHIHNIRITNRICLVEIITLEYQHCRLIR